MLQLLDCTQGVHFVAIADVYDIRKWLQSLAKPCKDTRRGCVESLARDLQLVSVWAFCNVSQPQMHIGFAIFCSCLCHVSMDCMLGAGAYRSAGVRT